MRRDNIARTEAVRLFRELCKEREDRRFWEQAALVLGCVAAAMTGVMLALMSAIGML